MAGFLKLYRDIIKKPIWKNSTPEQKSILITILCMVRYEEEEWEWGGEKYTCKPGQVITSLEKIAEYSGKGISVQNVRTALNRFEKYEFLTNVSTNKNRLITITNWDLYQGRDCTSNKQTNMQLTSSQQADNKQITPNKEFKELNNEKKKDIRDAIANLTTDESLSKAIFAFAKMRTVIGKPLDTMSLTLIFSKLNGITKDVATQIKILEKSTINQWADIFPLKETEKEKEEIISGPAINREVTVAPWEFVKNYMKRSGD